MPTTNMDQMQMMMAQMHAESYSNNMQLAQYFQNISGIYTNMAQGDYKMYQYHASQASGMMPGTMPGMPGMTPGMMPGMPGMDPSTPIRR